MDRGAAPTCTEAVRYFTCTGQRCPNNGPFFSTMAYSRTAQQIVQDAAPTTLSQGIPRDSPSPPQTKLSPQPTVDREENSQTLPSKSRAFNLHLINRVTHLFSTVWGLVGCADRSHQCQGALLSPGSGHGHGLVTSCSSCGYRVRRASAVATACR